MNKSEFVDLLSKKLNSSKSSASRTIDTVFGCITDALKKEKDLRFIGFGTFEVQDLPEREVKTPISGKIVTVSARRHAKFKPGKRFKDIINNRI